MKRLLVVTILAAASVFSLGACNKPSEDSCRKALANMQRLMGTENLRDPGAMEGEVRRCKGGSKKSAVNCAIKAQTFEELKHCNFYHLPDNALPSNLRDGSAATGSATTPDMGSAAGSAAMGSGAGSAAMGAGSAAMGSGAGSAAMGAGSAAMGSAAGGSGAASGSGASSGSAAGTGAAKGSGAKAATGAAKGDARAKSETKKAVDSADPMEGGQ